MAGGEFTSHELYEQAEANLTAFILTTIAYLKEHNQSPQEWITFIGTRFAPAWQQAKDQGAKAAIELLVLNLLATGGTLRLLQGDDTQAEATIVDWPPDGILEFFRLTQDDADNLYDIFKPIAASLNLHYQWHRKGNRVIFKFTRN